MNRRDFLKSTAAAGLAVSVTSLAAKPLGFSPIEGMTADVVEIPRVRKISQYDLTRDLMVNRVDLIIGDDLIGITWRGEVDSKEETRMLMELARSLKKQGFRKTDTKPHSRAMKDWLNETVKAEWIDERFFALWDKV